LSAQLNSLALQNHTIIERLPKGTISINLTPTGASDRTKDSNYLRALDDLGISLPQITENVLTLQNCKLTIFLWSWTNKAEADSYNVLQEALTIAGYDSRVVGDGKHLIDGLLFNQEYWTIRKCNHDKNIWCIGSVKGRTDLVVLKNLFIGEYIMRHQVLFAIEIKTYAMMGNASNLNASIRIAVTQLIGLCAGNIHSSPAVVLTDLTQFFLCIYLTTEEKQYRVIVQRCENLGTALNLAEEKSNIKDEDGYAVGVNFARRPTPASS
jgi:hypothetical protein